MPKRKPVLKPLWRISYKIAIIGVMGVPVIDKAEALRALGRLDLVEDLIDNKIKEERMLIAAYPYGNRTREKEDEPVILPDPPWYQKVEMGRE